MATVVALSLVACLWTEASAGLLDVGIQEDGSYILRVGGTPWFKSSTTSLHIGGHVFSNTDGSLKLVQLTRDLGGAKMQWKTTTGVTFETLVHINGSNAVFTQMFPVSITNTSVGNRDSLVTSFPALSPLWSEPKGVISYQGDHSGRYNQVGTWQNSGPRHAGHGLPSCRVQVGSAEVGESNDGFSAYIRNNSVASFAHHSGSFCRTAGPYTYASDREAIQEECARKCEELACSCYDFRSPKEAARRHFTLIGSGLQAGPTVVFDRALNATLVMSAASNFMAHSQIYNSTVNTLAFGIMGSVTEIPAGYSISTVVSFGVGITHAMNAWGGFLLGMHSARDRYAYRNDLAMQYLGYSTDNGAYYYYQTEPDQNYQQTLTGVAQQAHVDGIPYRYILLDSWWYFKGKENAVKAWEPMSDIFPGGLGAVYNSTGQWPQQLHNRHWSTDNIYAKQNGGKYNFIIDGSRVSVPDDEVFWEDLLKNKSKTGMFMYEQDWLDTEFFLSKSLVENATLGRTWLMQMNHGARAANVTVQLCMAYSRHVLQSVEMDRVTNTRSSGDYLPGGRDQWNVGTTSIFAHAVGLAPSKDTYWSSTTERSSKYGKGKNKESYPEMESVVSSLTTGPVAPSDKIGLANASIINRCCDIDGLLLTPDRPAVELDSIFVRRAIGDWHSNAGHIWETSVSMGVLTFRYVLGIFLQSEQVVTLKDLGIGGEVEDHWQAREFGSDVLVEVSEDKPLLISSCPAATGGSGFRLFTMSPVGSSGITLLGEMSKWVAVSRQRFSDLTVGPSNAGVRVSGVVGEVVEVSWKIPSRVVVSTCSFTQVASSSQHQRRVYMHAYVQDGVAGCHPDLRDPTVLVV